MALRRTLKQPRKLMFDIPLQWDSGQRERRHEVSDRRERGAYDVRVKMGLGYTGVTWSVTKMGAKSKKETKLNLL